MFKIIDIVEIKTYFVCDWKGYRIQVRIFIKLTEPMTKSTGLKSGLLFKYLWSPSQRHSICIETKGYWAWLHCKWYCKTSNKFKFNGNLLVKKNDAICSQAQGSVAAQQLSLIQCYINFPIYAALVKYKALKHLEVAVCYVGVDACGGCVWEGLSC